MRSSTRVLASRKPGHIAISRGFFIPASRVFVVLAELWCGGRTRGPNFAKPGGSSL